MTAPSRSLHRLERRTDRGEAAPPAPAERRRASRSLWAACEALLAADRPRAVSVALERLRRAFEADGIALSTLAPNGEIEHWCARGDWKSTPGDLRDCLSVPLQRGAERVGVLELKAPAGRRWRPDQFSLIRTAAGALGAALGARIELERLRHQPGRDATTGLPDARAFHARLAEELSRACRHGLPVALVVVDLDHFAALNQRFGREVADEVLAETALVLKLALRESDIVARLGGDSFAMVLPETDAGPAVRCADRMRRAVEEHAYARVRRVTASVGVSSYPREGADPVELLHAAEQALAVAKKSGRRRAVAARQAGVH